MKHKVDSGFAKFLKDTSRKQYGIEVLHYDEEYIQLKIPQSANGKTDWYMVECLEGYWKCQCIDYEVQQGRTQKNVGIGSYCCKHIEEAHFYIAKLKGIFEQQKLIPSPDEKWMEAKITEIYPDGYQFQFQGIANYPKGKKIKIGNFDYIVVNAFMEGDKTLVDLKREE